MVKEKGKNIYDIASEAGVSIATVSRVLRGETSVLPETRRKVEDVIAKRGYRPSAIARGLTQKHTNSLGIVLPKLTNPNYAMIFTGAYDEATREGYVMSLFPWKSMDLKTGYDPMEVLAERRLDGLIMCVEYQKKESYDHLTASLENLSRYMPLVLIGCVPSELDYPTITYDMSLCASGVMEYLLEMNHTRIALLGGMKEDMGVMSRDAGYRAALEKAKLPYISSYRVYGDSTTRAGEQMLTEMLDGLQRAYWPTAVIALNDLVALGALKAAREMGLRVPEDISIIGCDDLFCAPYSEPPLTSINMHQQELGARAVRRLLRPDDKTRELAAWNIVKRQSSAPTEIV
ncbi:MAG: LacI family DNA-binding transcriptional regulator [Eubacteriales bacterium]|nr:LacI family DNA-binding transcriptional regulator [Eubacteriales bacterium]MDD3881839.1 LacI family DNA-binding transcriptional regulator [Eubacteriales bacterium]MDD4512915.1 LacI family DNA-binding transcriptional regulator [Eubacteriales bacterium]